MRVFAVRYGAVRYLSKVSAWYRLRIRADFFLTNTLVTRDGCGYIQGFLNVLVDRDVV